MQREEAHPAGRVDRILMLVVSRLGTVPPEVIERSRKDHKANVLAVANQFNQESKSVGVLI